MPVPRQRPALRILVAVACLLVAATGQAQNAVKKAAKKVFVGDTKVETVAKYQGGPLPKPEKVLVYDFTVPGDVISVDTSAASKMTRRGKTAEGEPKSSPEVVARQVQSAFSKSLVSELQRASVPAEAAPAGADTAAAPNALLVQGEFTAVNEGSKTKRVLIGFGKGASDVQAHVTVKLAASSANSAPLEKLAGQPPAGQPPANPSPTAQPPTAQPPAGQEANPQPPAAQPPPPAGSSPPQPPAAPSSPAGSSTIQPAASQQPVMVLEFNVKSKSGKKPGAAATVGAGAVTAGVATAAAAGTVTAGAVASGTASSAASTAGAGKAAAGVATGGALDRSASVEGDAARMAKAVAQQIVELMRSQTWAPAQAQPPS
jgi:Domain of unknown function (DUF4410)